MRKYRKRILLIGLFIVFFMWSLTLGSYYHETSWILSTKAFLQGLFKGDKTALYVLTQSRLPRTIAIVLVASGLSVAGLVMQSISRNKFISPSTAGTTDAAVLGILISYLIIGSSIHYFVRFFFAFGFAMLSSLVFIYMLSKIKIKNVIYVPLIGIMYGSLIGALSLFIAQQFNVLPFLNSIGIQGFTSKAAGTYEFLYLMVPGIIIAFIYATKFNIVSLGEDFSKNLGINYKRVLFIGIVIIALIASTSFLVVGSIPFLGLIIPNLVSQYYGDNIKRSIFDIALFGSIFVLINDIISRIIIYSSEVPISFTMGVTGAIIFLILIFRRIKYEST